MRGWLPPLGGETMVNLNLYDILLALNAESITSQKEFPFENLQMVTFPRVPKGPNSDKVLDRLTRLGFQVVSIRNLEDGIDFASEKERKQFAEQCRSEEYVLFIKGDKFYYTTIDKIIIVNKEVGENPEALRTMVKDEMAELEDKITSYEKAIDIEKQSLAKLNEVDLFIDNLKISLRKFI